VNRESTPSTLRAVLLAFLLLIASVPVPAAEKTRSLDPEVETFIGEMVQKHQFEAGALRKLFVQVKPRPGIVRAMSAPATARPWHEFRRSYIEPRRISGGVAFWREHATTLEKASREFGVPEEIIVATIGVETFYGRHTGNFRVLDALATLAFNYPPRAELFRSELEHYLLLTREAGIDATGTVGSYAGAMGLPQFLPSSYRRYAIDFDGDGKKDIVNSMADAIGSVANYYKTFGWRPGGAVIVPVEVSGNVDAVLEAGIKPEQKVAELRKLGVTPAGPVDEGAEAALITAVAATGPRYWLGLNNFYVITRYNRSVNYALTVHELAGELRSQFRPAR
jgi:membrane-bound lytic murein transglycosylase B